MKPHPPPFSPCPLAYILAWALEWVLIGLLVVPFLIGKGLVGAWGKKNELA